MNIEEIRERHSKVEIDQYGSPAGEFYGELETSEFVDESHKDVAYLLSIIETVEKALTYYAEEPYLGSIGYSSNAIEALQMIRGN